MSSFILLSASLPWVMKVGRVISLPFPRHTRTFIADYTFSFLQQPPARMGLRAVYRERCIVLFYSPFHSLFSVQCTEEAVSVQCTEVWCIKAITCKRTSLSLSFSFSSYFIRGKVIANPCIHSSGFMHGKADFKSLLEITCREPSPERMVFSHTWLFCPCEVVTLPKVEELAYSPAFFFFPPCTLHLAQHNPPDNSSKSPWLLVWPYLELVGVRQ